MPSISNVKSIREKATASFKNRSEDEKKRSLESSRAVRMRKYGSFNNGKKISNSIKNRTSEQKKKTIEKRKSTNLKTYGVEFAMHTQKSFAKANSTRWSKIYDSLLEDNDDVQPLFTKDYFCLHGNEVLKWKCRKCGNVFEAKYKDHATQNMKKAARCLKCYPLNCRESKTENEVCMFL